MSILSFSIIEGSSLYSFETTTSLSSFLDDLRTVLYAFSPTKIVRWNGLLSPTIPEPLQGVVGQFCPL